ncbi:penicillin acylase family protein [Oceanisphaera arctica]|uniref:Penicillin amidase n=1 Tax=Oceanisphaera arctica TaxID=641510 RepID=A0A2P5TL45_9GAMM|nr:penicillin acylase family protein [Oceanisphaera arctica]PPL15955.1 penicillin amidase [Oceanisphaera arctica]GHA21589.1 penicillin amidase [Oceanisphaera arctica]
MSKKPVFLLSALASLSLLAGCTTLPDAEQVTIQRDQHGTPHIYADTTYGLFYGYGYAIAQDRLFQVEMARRSAQGTVAEVLGEEFLPLDIKVRQHYNPHAIQAQLDALPAADRDILSGYAAGLNQWQARVQQEPGTLMPKQFIDYGFTPAPWNEFDVAMLFIGSMINRFGDYNTELENQQLLLSLEQKHGKQKAQQLFDTLLPYISDKAVDTIPVGDWSATGRQRVEQQLTAGITHAAHPNEAPLLAMQQQPLSRQGTLGWQGFREAPFSNMLVLGKDKTKDASAVLINGPQFGFYQPAYTYSVGLHGAGYEAVGNSPTGYAMVEFGHNGHISWGSTWGAGDNVDLFRLTLNPGNPEQYLYKGQYRSLEKEQQSIKVKDAADTVITVYRSVYGPVVDYRPDEGIAYAKQRGWAGKEVSTLMAWNKVSKAKNHQQWRDHVAHSAINVNWYYADRDGNIGYALGGHYPVRHPGQDGRLPTPGDGSADWLGLYPFDTNPQVYNPSSGYIANWNNRPAEGFPNPDQWWYSWNQIDRVQEINSRVDAIDKLTPDQAWDLMMEASLADPNARFFVPHLVELAQSSQDTRLQQAARLLADWDYLNTDADRDGRYDNPASALFRAWLQAMLSQTYQPLIPAQKLSWYTGPGYGDAEGIVANGYNISTSTKALGAWLNRSVVNTDLLSGRDGDKLQLTALKQAIDKLSQKYGTDSSQWLGQVDVLEFGHKNYIGVPQANPDEAVRTPIAMNRGTENNMTVFNGAEVKAYEVAAPGQSGFIAPDGTRSPHYRDQLDDFIEFRLKPVWLKPEDVAAASQSETVLTVER